jgi:hypothetical protein
VLALIIFSGVYAHNHSPSFVKYSVSSSDSSTTQSHQPSQQQLHPMVIEYDRNCKQLFAQLTPLSEIGEKYYDYALKMNELELSKNVQYMLNKSHQQQLKQEQASLQLSVPTKASSPRTANRTTATTSTNERQKSISPITGRFNSNSTFSVTSRNTQANSQTVHSPTSPRTQSQSQSNQQRTPERKEEQPQHPQTPPAAAKQQKSSPNPATVQQPQQQPHKNSPSQNQPQQHHSHSHPSNQNQPQSSAPPSTSTAVSQSQHRSSRQQVTTTSNPPNNGNPINEKHSSIPSHQRHQSPQAVSHQSQPTYSRHQSKYAKKKDHTPEK